MPGSMDGIKLAAAIRGRWPPIQILVTSGHHGLTAGELPERCVFIPKPYRFDKIVATLRRMAT
jgi:DNA-binding LytR/AlgR family response regulator